MLHSAAALPLHIKSAFQCQQAPLTSSRKQRKSGGLMVGVLGVGWQVEDYDEELAALVRQNVEMLSEIHEDLSYTQHVFDNHNLPP